MSHSAPSLFARLLAVACHAALPLAIFVFLHNQQDYWWLLLAGAIPALANKLSEYGSDHDFVVHHTRKSILQSLHLTLCGLSLLFVARISVPPADHAAVQQFLKQSDQWIYKLAEVSAFYATLQVNWLGLVYMAICLAALVLIFLVFAQPLRSMLTAYRGNLFRS